MTYALCLEMDAGLGDCQKAPAGMSKNSVIYPDTYILDSGVAELILDGELWLREPGLLVRYRSDLQATLLHPNSKMTISDLEKDSFYIQKAVNAWRWAEIAMKSQGNTRLLLTPTVQAELSDALQFREQAWKCFEEVGLEELYGMCYQISPAEVSSVVSTPEMAAIAPIHLTPAEEEGIHPVFSNKSTSVNDVCYSVKIYIEACIVRELKNQQGNVVILIADNNNKFFQAFAQSLISEDILLERIQTLVKAAQPRDKNGVEDTQPRICVKLAGEIIPGISSALKVGRAQAA